MLRRGRTRRRLQSVSEEIARLRAELEVLELQLAHSRDVADDAGVRALASDGPADVRASSAASGDLRRVTRERDRVAERLAGLRADQDALLEQLEEEVNG